MSKPTRRRLTIGAVGTAAAAMLAITAGLPAAMAAPAPTAPIAAASPAVTRVAAAATTPKPIPAPASTADAWATKPYMGWSSYSMQVYSGNGKWITADQVVKQSDAMHAKLQKYGYDYINVDSGWNDGFDAYGRPKPSSTLYPHGLQKVIDHVHANGQKFGLYLIPGISPDIYKADLPIYGAPGCTTHDIAAQPTTTADYWGIDYKIDFSNPCAQKYVDSIVDELADWGVNFVKFDSVTPGSGITDLSLDARDDVAAWSKALKAHKIWFELSWALDPSQSAFWRSKANGWRVDWDVECYCGTGVALTDWNNIARLFPDAAARWNNAGDGGWNDFDSLDVGNGTMDGMTKDERQTATTLWAISAAPLYTGNDLTDLDAYGTSLLTNSEVIAVDQNGTPARPVSTASPQQVWYALNPDGTYTVALFNLGRADRDVTAKWSDIGLSGSATIRDLWSHKNLGSSATGFTASDVPLHGVRLLKVTPKRGASVSVNDDALRVSYGGAWTSAGDYAQPSASQALGMKVTDSGTAAAATESGPTVTTKLNDTDAGIEYTGSWSQSTGRGNGDYQDDVHYTEQNGDSFQYKFNGTGVSYVTETDASQGDVDVYIDGSLVKTVSTARDAGQPRLAQQTVFSTDDLPYGSHTLKVVKKSGSYMLLDRLDVIQPSLIDPSSASFDLKAPADVSVTLLRPAAELEGISRNGESLRAGRDYTVSGSSVTLRSAYLATLPVGTAQLQFSFRGDLLDDIHATTRTGASVSYTFDGTGVDWVTAKAPDQGLVDVYIDGKPVKRVDTHGDARTTQQTVFSASGLKRGTHTFMAVKVSGDVMRSDVIRYTAK